MPERSNIPTETGRTSSSHRSGQAVLADVSTTSPVVALIVGRDPGAWFDDTLASLAAQDHPAFSILVIDDGSTSPLQGRVAEVVPSAFVRRHEQPMGFGHSANLVREMVSGAGFYLFCHDDVALAPDAVRLMVAEAIRSGSSVVGPKLVSWLDHDRLLAVGLSVDRAGSPVSLVERDERDQGQHDVAQPVVAVGSAAVLVRADAFHTIGGFDATLTEPERVLTVTSSSALAQVAAIDPLSLGPDLGEDLDFCWRARISGHSVVLEPLARVAHLAVAHGATPWVRTGDTPDEVAEARNEPDRLGNSAIDPQAARRLASYRERNRIRSMVTTSSGVRLPFIVPILVLQTLWRSVSLKHRLIGSAAGVAPWRHALRNFGTLRTRRRVVQAARTVADREALSGLLPIGARARAALRADVSADSARLWNLAEHSSISAKRANRVRVGLLLVGVLTFLVGSRGILLSGLPDVGQFMPLRPVREMVRAMYLDQERPPANTVLGILKAFLGSGATLRVVTVGMLVIGAVSIWRLAALLLRDELAGVGPHQRRKLLHGPQTAVAGAYIVGGLGINAIASARIDGAVTYGLLPLVISRLVVAARRCADDPSPTIARRVTAVAPAAVISALMVAFAPGSLWALVVVVVAFLLNGTPAPVTSDRGQVVSNSSISPKSLMVTTGWLFAEIGLLLLPWTFSLFTRSFRWEQLTGGDFTRAATLPIDVLLRLGTGREEPSMLAWGLLAVAALPVLVGSEFRLRRSVTGWTLAVLAIAMTWLGSRGWLGSIVAHPTVALAPAAVGLAIAGGLGAVTVSGDLRSQKFGWRQATSLIATALFVLAAVPVLAAAGNGRWMLPVRSTRSAVSWMSSPQRLDRSTTATSPGAAPNASTQGPAVWIGGPSVLPSAGWTLNVGFGLAQPSFAVIEQGVPGIVDQWLPSRRALDDRVENALGEVVAGGTSRFGALVPELRYLVLVERAAFGARRGPSLAGLRSALRRQFDLREVEAPSGLTVFENVAWNGGLAKRADDSRAVVVGVLRVVQVLAWLVAFATALRLRRRRSRELVLLDQERSFDEDEAVLARQGRVGDFLSTSFDETDDQFGDAMELDSAQPASARGGDQRRIERSTLRVRTGRTTRSPSSGSIDAFDESTERGNAERPEPQSSDEPSLADELWDQWSRRQDRRRASASAPDGTERRRRPTPETTDRRHRDAEATHRGRSQDTEKPPKKS